MTDRGGVRHRASDHLRYMGFEQKDGIRSYRFERQLPGEKPATLVVTTNLDLFARHHVGIQEGPGLCMQLLAAELDHADVAARPPAERALTDHDMLAHLATRPAPGSKHHAKRRAAATPHNV